MLRRLLRFIRHINEPTFDDPKASRWADIFQKRARLTGQLPEPDVLERMGIPREHPFWKQDNANPSAGFAVNLGQSMEEALIADSPADLELHTADDFGRPVAKLPLSKTSPKLWFGISNSIYPLEESGRNVGISDIVWQAARAFRDLLAHLETQPDDPQDEADDETEDDDTELISFDPSDYTIRRISWDRGVDAWYVITEIKKA